MSATLLCIGDIHLGRRPTRIPPADSGVDVTDLTPAVAWRAAVDLALAKEVDAVLLAGDVVDHVDDRFEAYGVLDREVRRLTESGIPVFGVAGNHDVEALPRLAKQIPEFKLLGTGGQWELHRLEAHDGTQLNVLGWSFPAAKVYDNPLATIPRDIDRSLPIIGLLHCDLGVKDSPYAPVPQSGLDSAPGNAWFLGHIHAPDPLDGTGPRGYLGSLVGLRPGDTGPHGPWLVEADGNGDVAATQLPGGPVRWEEIDVDLSKLGPDADSEVVDSFASILNAEMAKRHAAIANTLGTATRAVACRFTLKGRTTHHHDVARLLRSETQPFASLFKECDETIYFVDKIIDDASPELDLEQLARGNDPPALLARRLVSLRDGDPAAEKLLSATSSTFDSIRQDPRWGGLGDSDLAATPEENRDIVMRAGRTALEELLASAKDEDGQA